MTKLYDLSGKRVWVAGHRGMVGSAIVRRLADMGCEVLTVGRDIADLRRQAEIEAWLAEAKPEAIFLAAATVGGIHANEILTEAELPQKYVGISHCFRTEAGAAGQASKGLYRVHQFTKVEMFAFTHPDDSEKMLEAFCRLECEIFNALGIPFRVVDTATGD